MKLLTSYLQFIERRIYLKLKRRSCRFLIYKNSFNLYDWEKSNRSLKFDNVLQNSDGNRESQGGQWRKCGGLRRWYGVSLSLSKDWKNIDTWKMNSVWSVDKKLHSVHGHLCFIVKIDRMVTLRSHCNERVTEDEFSATKGMKIKTNLKNAFAFQKSSSTPNILFPSRNWNFYFQKISKLKN